MSERAAEVEAPRWDVEPLTDERGEEGTGSALPIREVHASNKTGHNIAAQGSDEYLTANRGGLEMQREAFRGRASRVTRETCLFCACACAERNEGLAACGRHRDGKPTSRPLVQNKLAYRLFFLHTGTLTKTQSPFSYKR